MADITISVPYTNKEGKTLPVNVTIPKDKLKFDGDKVTGGDEEYINKAVQMAAESRYPNDMGISVKPPTLDPKPDSSSFAGRFSQIMPPPEDQGVLAGFKRAASSLNPANWFSSFPNGSPMGLASKLNQDQRDSEMAVEMKNLPFVSGAARIAAGDWKGELAELSPMVLAALMGVSPKLRAGAVGAVVGGVKESFGSSVKFRGMPLPPAIASAAGGAVAGHYAGHPIAGATIGALAPAMKGAFAGAAEASRGKPWISPSVTNLFTRTNPGKPSPALLPQSAQFNMPGRTIPISTPAGNPATQMPPVTPQLPQMPPVTPQLPNINPSMPKALPAPSTEPIRSMGAIPMPEAQDFHQPFKVSPKAKYEVKPPAAKIDLAPKPEIAKPEEPKVIARKPENKLTDSGLQTFAFRRPGGITLSEIQEHFGATAEEAKARLADMEDNGLVHRKGSKWFEGKEGDKPAKKEKPTVKAPVKSEDQPKTEQPKVEQPKKWEWSEGKLKATEEPKLEEPKPEIAPEMQAKYTRRDDLQKRLDNKEVLSNKEFVEWNKLDKEIIEHEKDKSESPKEDEPSVNTLTSPETAEEPQISHEEIGKIADSLGVTFTQVGRALTEKGYNVQASKYGSGKYGLERIGKRTLNTLLDEIGDKKLDNILELMGKKKKR